MGLSQRLLNSHVVSVLRLVMVVAVGPVPTTVFTSLVTRPSMKDLQPTLPSTM